VLIAMGKAQSENAEDRLLIGICIIWKIDSYEISTNIQKRDNC
jgi:hypothetical protein